MSDFDPGANRHIWETRMAALEEDLDADPVAPLAELLDLVEEVLQAFGYETIGGEGDPEVEASLERAREFVRSFEAGNEIRHDDAYQAAAELRSLFRTAAADPGADAGADLRLGARTIDLEE